MFALFSEKFQIFVNEFFEFLKLTRMVRVNRLRWTGHAIRRPAEAPLKKVLKLDFVDGKRSRGWPQSSWKEAVDNNSIPLGIGKWQICTNSKNAAMTLA
jgi:hypothetical protein